MKQLPLFVFGTLRLGQCNHHLLVGNYARRVSATLPGFRLSHPLMIVPDPGGRVRGELYFLHPAAHERTLADCDELEEVPRGTLIGEDYRRLAVLVETDDGETTAWAYVHAETPDNPAGSRAL